MGGGAGTPGGGGTGHQWVGMPGFVTHSELGPVRKPLKDNTTVGPTQDCHEDVIQVRIKNA